MLRFILTRQNFSDDFQNTRNRNYFHQKKKKSVSACCLDDSAFGNLLYSKCSFMDYGTIKTDRVPRCLECGDEIVYGRKDKKFCSDECRHKHHNDNHRSCRHYKRMVGAILDRNHEILEELVRAGIKAIWVADAIAMGYNPAYVTSYRKHGKRSMCHCYDICYVATDNRMTSISKIQNLSLPLQAVFESDGQ